MKNLEITTNKLNNYSVEINIKNEDGEVNLLALAYNGFSLTIMNPKVEELKLLSIDGDVELLSGPLKGEVCLLSEGELYIMPVEDKRYENNIKSYYDEEKGYVYKIGNKDLIIKQIIENFRAVDVEVTVE